jgi:hypothetical protein
MFKLLALSVMIAFAVTGVSQTPVACSNMTLGSNGALNGFVPSPTDAWHQDVTNAALDPNSAKIISTTGDLAGSNLHPDFGSIAGGDYGIPYTVVDSSTTPGISVPITIYPVDSDITLYPIPATLPIEGSPGECPTDGNDRHAIVVDRNGCVAYEMYQAAHCTSGWTAAGGILWDFTTAEKRPFGLSSADAAGLSVFEGLIRYDEIVAGVINHAIRFTAGHTKSDANNGYFTAPATHAAGNNATTDNIMGMRIRLKADFDISGFSSTNQIILKAMKQYGMILADNGTNMFFQGTPDSRWSDDDLGKLKAIPSTDFDVVQMGPVYDAATAPTGAAPVITSFKASASSVPSGTSVTLTPVMTGASYAFIDKVGFNRGPVTVAPTATTTYMLTARNAYGTTTASVTVTVTSPTGGTPVLAFASIANATTATAPFAVSATSQSTGAVAYAIVSGPAKIAGSTMTVTGAGTVVVKATQAAAGTYTAATAQTSFAVAAGPSSLAITPIATRTWSSATIWVSSTTNSPGSISYSVVSGPATMSGSVVTLTGVGTVVLNANQAASGSFAATTATTSFVVSADTTKLTFVTVATRTYGNAPFTLKATSLSTAPVTYAVVSGPGTLSGTSVTITGAGTIVVSASQAASGDYSPATTTMSVQILPLAAKPVFTAIPAQTFGNAPFTVKATSASTAAITYAVVSGPATVSGSTVTLTAAGTVTLSATQAASGGYSAGTGTISFTVAAAK